MGCCNNNQKGREPGLPSAVEQVTNLLRDLPKALSKRANADVRKARREACESCEHFRKSDKRCSKCGCFMYLKVAVKRARCPDGRWPETVSANPREK